MNNSSLKAKAIHGAFWSFTERFGLLLVQFIVSITLARTLSPSEFGLVAMLTIFTLLAQIIVISGFGSALIQKKECTIIDESTVFWFNLLIGALMTLALCLSAPWIARFYNEPQLLPITRIVSLNLFINSFGIVQNVLMQKQLLFKRRTVASMVGILASGITGIALARLGFGVWALVVQALTNNLLRTGMLWIVHPWRPRTCFSLASLKDLFKFGSSMLFSGILNTIFDNIYLLVIGRLYSATDLGFYHRAKEFVTASSRAISMVISQVNFPVLSQLQHDPNQIRNAFSQILSHALFVIVPLMVGLGVCSPGIVQVLLGEKWMPCVPYLQILCISGGLFPVGLLNLNILMAIGRSNLIIGIEVAKKMLIATGILLAFKHGIKALLLAQVAVEILTLFLNCHFTGKLIGYGLPRQLLDNSRMLISCLIMGLSVYAIGEWIHQGPLLQLSIQVALGAVIFLASSWILKDPVLAGGLSLVLKKIGLKKY